uniref:Odorant binding protein 13 n=1 Tax=Tomicus yunnanensis TaxID=768153 RepID=A0A4P2HQ89_9CUCU|nr:odorant binding protein 13 [Tomicus yunnanensis]
MNQLAMIVLSALCVVHCKGLECGLSKINSDHFRKVATECVKDNQTLSKIWELTSELSMEEESSVSSDEEIPLTKGNEAPNSQGLGSTTNRNVKLNRSSRMKRSRSSKSFNNDSPMSNVQRKSNPVSSTTEEITTMQNEEEDESIAANNVENSEDGCILQCIFEKLEMTDTNGLPDHKKFASTLVKSATGRVIQNFLQESTDECFQGIEEGNFENPCEYSTKLVTCLAEKGKSNCEDWPTGDLPF